MKEKQNKKIAGTLESNGYLSEATEDEDARHHRPPLYQMDFEKSRRKENVS